MLRTAAVDYARAWRAGLVDLAFYALGDLPEGVWTVDPTVEYHRFSNPAYRGVTVQQVGRSWIAVLFQGKAELFRLTDL